MDFYRQKPDKLKIKRHTILTHNNIEVDVHGMASASGNVVRRGSVGSMDGFQTNASKSCSIEIVSCNFHVHAFSEAKLVKIYATVIHNGSTLLTHSTGRRPFVEIDESFSYKWAIFNERINDLPRDAKVCFELRFLREAHGNKDKGKDKDSASKEIMFASCTVPVASLIEDVSCFDLTEVEPSSKAVSATNSSGTNPDGSLMKAGINIRLVSERSATRERKGTPVVGTLRSIVWQGRKINTSPSSSSPGSSPVYLTISLAAEGAVRHRTQTAQIPTDPIFDHLAEIPLTSLQGDVIIALWEVTNQKTHKCVGQIMIPLSWLTNMFMIPYNGPVATVSGWFQILPRNPATTYNCGGQYRPYISGTPQATGFGLDHPDKAIGFLNVQLTLTLNRPLLPSLLASPSIYAHDTVGIEVDDDQSMMSIIAAMMVTKNNLMNIYYRLRYPMWLITLVDIIRWREHPLFTFVAMCFHSYTTLVAPTWQYPLLLCAFFCFLGAVASRRRTFQSYSLYRPEIDIDPENDDSSLIERYHKLKLAAYSVSSLVESMRIFIDRMGNLFTWADPVLTIATIILLFVACASCSLLLFILPPNKCMFMMGFSPFIPDEFMDYCINICKNYTESFIDAVKEARKSKSLLQFMRSLKSKLESDFFGGKDPYDGPNNRGLVDADDATKSRSLSQPPSRSDGRVVTKTDSASNAATCSPAGGESGASMPTARSQPNIFFHTKSRSSESARRPSLAAFNALDVTVGSNARLLDPETIPAGHECSSFLFSQHWEKGIHESDGSLASSLSAEVNSGTSAGATTPSTPVSPLPAIASQSKWTSKWCDLWRAPAALTVTSSSGRAVHICLEGAAACYIGGTFIPSAKAGRLSIASTDGTFRSAAKMSGSDHNGRPRKELFGFRRTVSAAYKKLTASNKTSGPKSSPTRSDYEATDDFDEADLEHRDGFSIARSKLESIHEIMSEGSFAESASQALCDADDTFYHSNSLGGFNTRSPSTTSSPYVEIFCFAVEQPADPLKSADNNSDNSNSAPLSNGNSATAPAMEVDATQARNAFRMVFGCSSADEAYSWVYAINSVSGRRLAPVNSDEGGAGVDTSSMSTALAPPGGGGGSRKKNIKLSQMMKDYALAWVSLAPDDMELLHRHFCQTMQYGFITSKKGDKKGLNATQLNVQLLQKPFSRSPSVFPVWSGGFGAIEKRNLGVEPGQPYLSVTVVCARNLPAKPTDSQTNSIFFRALQHIYCELWLEPTLDQMILKSSKQPRSENPTFRDEVFFPLQFLKDIRVPSSLSTSTSESADGTLSESDLLARFKRLSLHFRIYLVIPTALSKNTTLLAQTAISMQSFPSLSESIPSISISEWFSLRGGYDVSLSSDCEVKIKLQIKT